jgi:hypothetical protein
MNGDMGREAFRAAAERAGLSLTMDEAEEALAGANRWRRNVEQLRGLVERDLEPALVFRAPRGDEHGS